MKKFLVLAFCLGSLFANDKPKPEDQPTEAERIQLFIAQRDTLTKEIQRLNAVLATQASDKDLNAKAADLAKKYNCESFNPDFTCVKKAK